MIALRSSPSRLTAAVCLLATAFAVDGQRALAMGIRWDRKELAHSADRASALIEVRGWGPEGGGSLAYLVEARGRRKGVDFLVSSTFSPGDSRRAQTVPVATCEQRLQALAAELTSRSIPGVVVNPERCRSKEREGLVTVGRPR
jgi:hypothetical protein